jgi:hypothetical protein
MSKFKYQMLIQWSGEVETLQCNVSTGFKCQSICLIQAVFTTPFGAGVRVWGVGCRGKNLAPKPGLKPRPQVARKNLCIPRKVETPPLVGGLFPYTPHPTPSHPVHY